MSQQLWKNAGSYSTFAEADEKRNKIAHNSPSMRVKVRRMSGGIFVVKVRNAGSHKSEEAATQVELSQKEIRKEKKRKAREKRSKNKGTNFTG